MERKNVCFWRTPVMFLFLASAPASLIAQEAGIPKIIPPSPSAISSFAAANNSNSYYTGKLSASVPLWDIPTKDFQLPISLNYTGGNGIRLEEIASWVGLGWGLAADYHISRTVNGFHDDKYQGYLSMDTIPVMNQANAGLYLEYAEGLRDSEPDDFYYSLPGGETGSFVFDLSDSIRLKEKKNIKITYTRDNNNLLNSFMVVDASGNMYEFTSMEKAFTYIVDGPAVSDGNYYANSWYITKMVNANRTDSVVFEYSQDTYVITTEVPKSEFSAVEGEEIKYSQTTYQSSRLSKIRFKGGTVDFVPSAASRKDIGCCAPYLDKIIVKNYKDVVLRTIQFNYAYFAEDRDYSVAETIYSQGVRLKLESLVVYPGDSTSAQGLQTSFEYYEDHRLPERNAKSRDHWGYYNGKSNSKLEQYRIVMVKNLGEPWQEEERGFADRSASFEYGRSYMLKKISYPTGGTAAFTFESNKVKSDKLDVKVQYGTYVSNTTPQDSSKSFTITQVTSPKTKVQLRCLIADPDPSISPGTQVFRVRFTRLSDNVQYDFDYYNLTDTQNRAPRYVFLDAGAYSVALQTNYNPNNMAASFQVSFLNEEPCNNCDAGGMRLKSIVNDAGSGQVTQRVYGYEDAQGHSTGVINAIPEYGLYVITDQNIPVSYVSMVRSSYPMLTTQGSFVGYSQVTESYDNQYSLGKTEYFYTTADNFPDNNRGRIYSACDDVVTYDGVQMDRYPAPNVDSRDFLQGLLLKRVDYRKTGSGSLQKIKEVEHIYDIIKYNTCQAVHPPDESNIINYTQQASAFKSSLSLGHYVRFYEIYGGYAMLKESREKTYENGQELSVVSTTDYGRNAEGFIDAFVPKKTEVVNSVNQVVRTQYKYAADFAGSAVYDVMVGRNMVNQFVEREQVNVTLDAPVSKVQMEYGLFAGNSQVALKSTRDSYAGNPLEKKDSIEVYDDYGNMCQVKGRDGVTVSYLWGYNNQYIVAKVVNATYDTARSYITQPVLDDPSDAAALRSHLNNLRNISGALVTTYTYNPLIGMTSETDPSGKTIYYEYDTWGRLKLVRDKDGNILRSFDYQFNLSY